MKIFHYSRSLSDYLSNRSEVVGLVPTMGALHAGHLALVREAKRFCDLVVVSIFVNPKQFNNPDDLAKYPKTVSMDMEQLAKAGVDVVFVPTEEQVYGQAPIPQVDITPLDTVLEGKYRPGHFKGVLQVLHRLFSIVKPEHVFFGQKDLQQCMVVKKLIGAEFKEITQHNCATVRESNDLAMSSRNTRLSEKGRQTATSIYKELKKLADDPQHFGNHTESAIRAMQQNGIETEYLDLVELPDMLTIESWSSDKRTAIVFAGYLEGVRLIDNIML